MSNRVKYGLKNVHYAVATEGAGGALTYATPVAVPGAVNLELTPRGEVAEFFADDSMYFRRAANQGYEGSLEMALIPDTFRVAVFGNTLDGNTALFEDADDVPKKIALLFEFDGDSKKTRHVLYYVDVSRPTMSSQTTTATKEPATETMDIVASPAPVTKRIKAKIEEGDTGYSTFFTTVYTFVPTP